MKLLFGETLMAKQKNKKKRQKSKSGKNRTPISGHTRRGGELLPPFAKIDKMVLSSWMNERLPEMVWAALIRSAFDPDRALGQFRRILNFIGKHPKANELFDVTLSGIAKLSAPLREEMITAIIGLPEVGEVLATLRLFQSLPAYDTWDRLLPKADPNVELLMDAVGSCLWHQSQEATDCRWLRVMGRVVAGKFHIPKETAKEWFGYPNEGDQLKVCPSIRAAEVAPNPLEPPDLAWPNAFWDEAWRNTPCLRLVDGERPLLIRETINRKRLKEVSEVLQGHWENTHQTTAMDAKHDAVFGMAFYALRLLEELLGIGIGQSILGRLGLRTILELHISLRYLLAEDDEEVWNKWRSYGAGQAKLNALKFDDNLDPPKHIDIESIERIAGEDLWEEFLNINLRNWCGLDLRRLSERTGLKDTYDKFYSWTSGYSHANWGPIREACYNTCGNPLHRLHRYPEQQTLGDTVDDAAEIVDEVLADLDRAFPSFPHRLSVPT